MFVGHIRAAVVKPLCQQGRITLGLKEAYRPSLDETFVRKQIEEALRLLQLKAI